MELEVDVVFETVRTGRHIRLMLGNSLYEVGLRTWLPINGKFLRKTKPGQEYYHEDHSPDWATHCMHYSMATFTEYDLDDLDIIRQMLIDNDMEFSDLIEINDELFLYFAFNRTKEQEEYCIPNDDVVFNINDMGYKCLPILRRSKNVPR